MMDAESFEIKLPQFEGPFDLLLFFIERDELAIGDISISKITDDFLNFLHQMSVLNMDIASEFIYVAATLMRIKSRMLLPRQLPEEEKDEINSKEDLIRKLIVYKQFKIICEELKILEENRLKLETRGNIATDIGLLLKSGSGLDDLQPVTLYKLLNTYTKVMANFANRSEEIVHTVTRYPYNIEEQKMVIANLLAINKKLDFNALYKLSDNKVHFVYNFLAVLEMLQQELANIQIGLGFNNFIIGRKHTPGL